jgi:hypothetical protein
MIVAEYENDLSRIKDGIIFAKIVVMIIVSRFLLRIFTGSFASAITLWPFVIVREKGQLKNQVLINHEKIHLRQQIELLIIFFYLWYGLEYLFYRLKGFNSKLAYRSIRFEKEAYQFESDGEYLNYRKCYAYVRSCRRKN